MKVKCRICGKVLEKEEAYCIMLKKADGYPYGTYYCSEEEYTTFFKKREMREKIYQLCAEILDTHFNNGRIQKMIAEVEKEFDCNVIFNYLYDKQDYLYRYLKNKTFVSMYGEIRYLKAILMNALEEYSKTLSQDVVKRVQDNIGNIDIEATKYKDKKKRRAFDELEDLC